MNQITFRTGDMQSYTATRNFNLGATGTSIPKGADLTFDGSVVEYAGQRYAFPQLRAAVKTGWVVPSASYDETDPNYGRPVRANIQVRHATQGGDPMKPQPKMTISTTESDEREVMSARTHAQQVAQGNREYVRGNPVNQNLLQAGERVLTKDGFEVVEQQDGVEVPGRTLKTAAGEKSKQSKVILTAESAARALQQAGRVTIEPGQGVSEEELLSRMSPDQRENYLVEKELRRDAMFATMTPQQQQAERLAQSMRDRKIVNAVPKAQTQHIEGMTFTPAIGGGTEIADPGAMGATNGPTYATVVEDGITFKTTNGPSSRHTQQAPNQRATAQQVQQAHQAQPVQMPMQQARPSVPEAPPEIRKMIAKAVCADFPDNYDFALPAKKRMARLQADYENRPDVIKAVFAAEGDEIKALLMQEFPQAFQAPVEAPVEPQVVTA
jgi:hypothetical protein